MKILEIYRKYQIMPQQAEHQFRVAAVADYIVKNIARSVPVALDSEAIIKACLLHDMGNLVKFDFNYTREKFLGLIDVKTLPYWEQTQREFRKKYGTNSHQATMKIIEDLGIGGRVKELVNCIGFTTGKANAESGDFGKKICAYSDMRVEPHGVVSLEERFRGLRERYRNHPTDTGSKREEFEQALREIEKQIFNQAEIKPEQVKNQAIAPLAEKLRDFEI
ncbi:MAG: HD domain-containing protein [Patescibacteria group bacterium]|nr:HD domain-containing protein [Patescibacteria group bacterium]